MPKAARKDQNSPVFIVDVYGVKSDIYKISRNDGGASFYKATMPYVEYMADEGLRKSRSFAKGQLATAHIVLDEAYRSILELESAGNGASKRSASKDSDPDDE